MNMMQQIDFFAEEYQKIVQKENKKLLPDNNFFLSDGSILCFPRNNGDSRFPYGCDGFNFWAYASGYMHANEGLFSPFLRANEGQEPKIAFFAGWDENKKKKIISFTNVPYMRCDKKDEIIQYTIFTKTCTYYITQTADVKLALRVFVDSKKRMFFTSIIKNCGTEEKNIFLSPYFNPFLCNSIYESSENRWFKKSEYAQKNAKDIGKFIFQMNEDISRTESVTNYGILNQSLSLGKGSSLLKQEATTSRYQFVGGNHSSLHTPEALLNGQFSEIKHITSFNDIAIAGEILHFNIPAQSDVRLDLELDYIIHSRDSLDMENLSFSTDKVELDKIVNEHIILAEEKDSSLKVLFQNNSIPALHDGVVTDFFSYLKQQVEFCATIKGYIQLAESSLIGIRDVFQALEGMIFFKPEQSKQKMLEALGFITPLGRCPRQYSLPAHKGQPPVMDLRQFIDQGVWVIDTFITYLKFTNDFGILDQSCGYYEIIDEKLKSVKKSKVTDSVLSHLLRIMEFLLDKKDSATNCIRILYGDWNDALDGLGVSIDGVQTFGSGVSIMATLQVYRNLYDMIVLLEQLGSHEQVVIDYKNAYADIESGLLKYAIQKDDKGEQRILHGWGDKKSYFVGSFHDPDGQSRYGLTSNAFWVISGMYQKDEKIKDVILNAFNHLDSKFGMKTFEPYFMPDTPGVGRIYKLPPGTAENGAAYIHATAFGIMALFMMGEPKKAWDQLQKILPFTHEHLSCSPYVMPNSYGYNKELDIDGESMQDWQTGASNVVFKLMLRFVFGFQPEYDGFFIQPASWSPFKKSEMEMTYQGKKIKICYSNIGEKNRSFKVNGVVCEGMNDTVMHIKKLWISNADLNDNTHILIED